MSSSSSSSSSSSFYYDYVDAIIYYKKSSSAKSRKTLLFHQNKDITKDVFDNRGKKPKPTHNIEVEEPTYTYLQQQQEEEMISYDMNDDDVAMPSLLDELFQPHLKKDNNYKSFASFNNDDSSMLEYLRSCLECIDTPIVYYRSFNFIKIVQDRQNIKLSKNLSNAFSSSLFVKDEKHILKNDLYIELSKLFSRNSFNYKEQEDIIAFANTLMLKVNNDTVDTTELSLREMTSYLQSGREDQSIIVFDCCINGDHVFVFDETKSHEWKCPTCKSKRYYPCRDPYCKSRDSCTEIKHKNHRTPQKQIFYRSVSMLLHDLCSSKLFRSLIKYKTETSNPNDNLYSDIMESPHVLNHLAEMAASRNVKSSNDSKKTIVPIDLILMEYYDGAQLFHSTVKEFCPLMISILNLPPTLRKIVNVGMFSISLFTGGKKDKNNPNICNSEQFIIGKLFVDEMLQLENEGIWVEDPDDMNIVYNVKARLISHVYDTAEQQHMCQVQGVQSSNGCTKCRLCQGIHKKELGSFCYLGHRRLLPLTHPLRYKGQVKQCCPDRFYAPNEVIDNNFMHSLETIKNQNWHLFSLDDEDNDNKQPNNNNKTYLNAMNENENENESGSEYEDLLIDEIDLYGPEIHKKQSYNTNGNNSKIIVSDYNIRSNYSLLSKLEATSLMSTKDINELNPCNSTKEQAKDIKDFLNASNERFVFFHDHICQIDVFQEYLYYHYCDYRQPKTLQRVDNNLYFYDNLMRFHETKTQKQFRGIKGVWPYWRLPYASIANDVCFCPFHTYKNIAYNVINNFKGTRCNSTKIKEYCEFCGFHSSLVTTTPKDDKKKKYNDVSSDEEETNTSDDDSDEFDDNSKKQKKKQSKTTNKPQQKDKPVWVLSNVCMGMIDTWLEAIMLPMGISEEYANTRFFDLTDSKKGVNMMRILITYMEIIIICIRLYQPNYPLAYLFYHRILSEVITDISSTSIPKDKEAIMVIFYRTVEMLCLHEGIYPPSESLFSYHQLIDIVDYLNVLGPIRNWWNLPAERMLSNFKDHKVEGGGKFYQAVFFKQIDQEQSNIRTFYHSNNSNTGDKNEVSAMLKTHNVRTIINKDNGMTDSVFSGNMINIIESSAKTEVKEEEIDDKIKDALYEFLVDHIVKIKYENKIEEACKHNKFVRLFYSFLAHKNHKNNAVKHLTCYTFFEWLYNVIADDRKSVITRLIYMHPLVDKPAADIFRYIQHAYIFSEDLDDGVYINELLKIKLKLYESAQIGEIKFHSRGFHFHEMYSNINNISSSILGKMFDDKIHISSWCKFYYGKTTNDSTDYYAQINSFCKVSCKINEPLIDNLEIASITTRKVSPFKASNFPANDVFKHDRKLAMISDIDKDYKSLIKELQFVDLTNIYPMPIGTLGLAYKTKRKVQYEILYMPYDTYTKLERKKYVQNRCTCDKASVKTIIIIDLKPEVLELRLAYHNIKHKS